MQSRVPWPGGAQAALSLTFDGGLPAHLELADRLPCPATFFVDAEGVLSDVGRWQALQSSGHEIGNGCLLRFATEQGHLTLWPMSAIEGEIAETDQTLDELFPSPNLRAFAFPWGEPKCTDNTDYRHLISNRLARSGVDGINRLESTDTEYVRTHLCEQLTAKELQQLLEQSLTQNAWMVLSIAEIGARKSDMDPDELLAFLEDIQKRQDLWVSPFGEIGNFVRTRQGLALS